MKLSKLWIALALACMVALPALAQDAPLPPMAALTDGQLTIYGGGSPRVVPVGGLTDPLNMTWSPDGSRLAFVAYDQDQTAVLLLTDAQANAPRVVATNLAAGFPGTFVDDDTLLYAQDRPDNPQPSGDWLIDVYRVGVAEEARPTLLGSFASQVGCGGGSPLPSDWQYWAELGIGGSRLTLAQTPFGIVHSMSCAGTGTGLLDTSTGADTAIDTILSRVALSPDGKRLAGVEIRFDRKAQAEARTLVTVELESQVVSALQTQAAPDQVTWSADGNALYYSSKARSGSVHLTRDELAVFVQATGLSNSVDTFTASVRRFDLRTGEDALVALVDAYAVGRLSAAPDGALYFNAIANMEAWALGVVGHQIDPADRQQQLALVPILFYRHAPADGVEPVELARDLRRFTLNNAAMQTP